LINNIKNVLNCSYIYKYSYKNITYLKVFKFKYIYFKIIPLFKEYKIQRVKSLDFQDFYKVVDLMKRKTLFN